jgi:hypothetical protein
VKSLHRRLAILLIGGLAWSLQIGVSLAQSGMLLSGTVADQSGRVVQGALVDLCELSSNSHRTAVTGREGEYQFALISPGSYSLKVTAKGFKRYLDTGLQLTVNKPLTAFVRLQLGSVTEYVDVHSDPVLVNVADASIGNSFAEETIKALPLEARNVADLLSIQPGVIYTGNRPDINQSIDTRSGAVNGARGDQSNITLDGVDVNDQSAGSAFTSVLPVTLDSVQEFRVTTSNYNADQGNGSAAQMALVTKSGSNTIHGAIYEYLRNTATSANDWFVKSSQIASGLPNTPDKLNRNIFGGSIGGPLRKNRLFYFANYEGTRDSEEQSTIRIVPTATLREGVLQYPNASGGLTSLTPQQIQSLDPLHLGANPAMLAYFDTYPLPNEFSVGDGLNFAGYRFRAPVQLNNNAEIARIDYSIGAKGANTLFWRGAVQDLNNPQSPFLPGTHPELNLIDRSKGSVVGLTSVVSEKFVNTFHWGFTRQSLNFIGDSNQSWNIYPGLDQGISYGHGLATPINNVLDDASLVFGLHTLQFGANLGFSRSSRSSLLNSFSSSTAALGGANPTGFANYPASPLDPTNGGFPAVNPAYNNTYDQPMAALLGIQVTVSAVYNYDKTGTLLSQGSPVKRNFGLNWYEIYGQDSWRAARNLTFTFGMRWSLLPPPWELNGEQVTPDVGLGSLFNKNVANMQRGIGYEADPLISYRLGGKANNGQGIYSLQRADLSPRLAVAYSPSWEHGLLRDLIGGPGNAVIRAGFGRVYDRPGFQLINSQDQQGSLGLTTTIMNPCCMDGAAQLPRITSLNVLPTVDQVGNVFYTPAPAGGFPFSIPAGSGASGWGVDDTLRTPYAYAFNLSFARNLPGKTTLQVAYVGRLGRRLLTMRDLMPQLNIADPQTGIDYFTAARRLAQLSRAGTPTSSVTDKLVGSTSAYWKDRMQPLNAGGAYNLYCTGGSTSSVVQAVYDLYACEPNVEVLGLALFDYYGSLTNAANPSQSYFSNGGQYSYQNSQFANMFAWSSIGKSTYNGMQATLTTRANKGYQFALNYTYSRSIDLTSSASRVGFGGSTYFDGGLIGDALVNQFKPDQMRSVSDFDLTHQFNAEWITQVPVGRGKLFASNSSKAVDAIVGGWQFSGLGRWTSGFPVSVDNGYSWATEWANEGPAQMLARPATGAFKQAGGGVNLFRDPQGAFSDFAHPLPGDSGSRNVLRGDGYAGLDLGLSKRWALRSEKRDLQARWEVFNVPNLVRFNVQATPPSLIGTGNFGNYSGLLTQPRVMQFALRYEF